ncbi:MAG: alkyl hydroperoxide reductase subunit F [Betaproteobacteria bacterium]|jgi:alkyl hydroperoxide reductase subunit F|nr:alkyl hydroperoxide reductase subunit F [Betaproteobacteria bacterium]MBP6466095.1 alkyl hydroperoxide reductase subunit F [Rubrivivax sp.]MBK7275828.1 alkyl hydroperoxide reductase subunit F [Betaproteobacteria bacterium]MBK7516826.1 alkyl hydroperoxide reductase subunit F [Betaproteobacteria bacterium]MBK8108269.1 alkyl hydroperoxide reductase subunit F [Betaproteobacteria bacterium]
MLDANLKTQLKAYLERVTQPIELVASLDERPASQEMRELLQDIAGLSDKIALRLDGQDERRPSFSISRAGHDMGVRFAAIPMGHEFTSLVLALLQAGGHPPKVEADVIAQIRALEGDFVFETYMSLTCHNCPDVVQALNLMAVLNPRVRHVAIDGGLFKSEVDARQIMAVPTVFVNGQMFGSGRMELGEILAKVDTGAAARDAARLADKAPYDMLVIGGGPAGAAAAVYAARKGIRTGIVAERFGGQTLDTMAIENYISVLETDGPKFAAALEAQVRSLDVDLMNGQRVTALEPATTPGGLVGVKLANGAELKSRSVVLAPGARWKNVNVPGEAEYRTKGVAYCPHCDGPLFKGKKVAVIGGGNSGVEAAIDLAGVVAHVTLLEFADQLKADAVLVNKLRSLPNVDIHTSAQTTAITGDGQKVNGLRYKDRVSGQEHALELAGVFVQIGLVPNTEWLKGSLELSRYGEILIDAHCATSVPGVFAAGDATTVPFKQIVIAAGEGAKAALSAFDHLIRQPVAA